MNHEGVDADDDPGAIGMSDEEFDDLAWAADHDRDVEEEA